MHHLVFRGVRAALLALVSLALIPSSALAQSAADDPVGACRAAHANDLPARVACLELAIEAMRGQQQQSAASEPGRPAWSLPGFRSRQEAERRQNESVRVTIVRVAYGRDGLGRFVTAEGQTWRETVEAPQRRWLENGRTYEAEISRSALGGFRMNVDGIRWEYKVEPVD